MLKGLIVGAMAAVFAVSASPVRAAEGSATAEAAALTPNTYIWNDEASMQDAAMQPVAIVVSIADQKAYVFRGKTMIAASSVSTGKDGKETPLGTFAILQKEEMHHSNLYDSAPMPFMQRLTWDGVAIHAGRNPGFPASHGCIRVPAAFAQKLFSITAVGTLVTVTDLSAADGLTLPEPTPDTVEAGVDAETARANAGQLELAAAR